MLDSAAQSSTLESRIQANRHNIQRTRAALDKDFTKSEMVEQPIVFFKKDHVILQPDLLLNHGIFDSHNQSSA